MTCSWSPLMSDSFVPSQSLFCPKCPVTLFAISPLWPLHFSVCCKILVPSGLWLLVQTQLFHVPLKSIIILVFFAAHVTNAIETSLMKTFHVAVKPIVIFEFLVAFFAIDCLDGVHKQFWRDASEKSCSWILCCKPHTFEYHKCGQYHCVLLYSFYLWTIYHMVNTRFYNLFACFLQVLIPFHGC